MAKSMTGFGRGESSSAQKEFVVEMKSVNHKFLDVSARMPRQFVLLEEKIRNAVAAKLNRGKVDIFVTYTDLSDEQDKVTVNMGLAKSYLDAVKSIAGELELQESINATLIAKFPEVVKVERKEEDLDEIWSILSVAVDQALVSLVAMRENEGQSLKEDIIGKLDSVEKRIEKIAEIAPAVPAEYKEKLEKRLAELSEGKMLDETRIATEVAIFSDKCSIDEELVRLKTHFKHMREIFEDSNPIGRKLDFLLQEMNREINTIGSKANNVSIATQVVEVKSEFEKIREQIQNIE